ncbi:MAG: hypothetical protein HOE90_12785 [Bacteriovoracaceae bacterium]|nr:hypothetical protein [Bacteriovoracaceae bacterium]
MRKSIALSALLILVAACSTTKDDSRPVVKYTSSSKEFSKAQTPAELYPLYHQAMKRLARRKLSKDKKAYFSLREIVSFYLKSTIWGSVEEDRYISLQKVDYRPIFLIIFPTEHPYVASPAPFITTDYSSGQPIIHLKPFSVTPNWGALFLIHELSHLMDNFFEKDGGELWHLAEIRAYDLSMEVAEKFTKGEYRIQLDAFLKRDKSLSAEQFFTLIFERFPDLERELEGIISHHHPASRQEKFQRRTFYLASYGLRFLEKSELKGEELGKWKQVLIELIHGADEAKRVH